MRGTFPRAPFVSVVWFPELPIEPLEFTGVNTLEDAVLSAVAVPGYIQDAAGLRAFIAKAAMLLAQIQSAHSLRMYFV